MGKKREKRKERNDVIKEKERHKQKIMSEGKEDGVNE